MFRTDPLAPLPPLVQAWFRDHVGLECVAEALAAQGDEGDLGSRGPEVDGQDVGRPSTATRQRGDVLVPGA